MSGHDHGRPDGTGLTIALNLAVNLALTAAKWIAFLLTGSPSLFGEAAHSTADSLNPILLWIGFQRGRRPKDARHPFGHDRETFFMSLIAAEAMFILGACLTAWRGIATLISGDKPDFSPWSLGIMIFALAAEGFTFTLAYRKLKRENGGRAVAGLAKSRNTVLLGVLLENGVDTLGVVLAFLGFGLFALTGQPVWDALFSLAIAALLTASSVFLIVRNRSLIVGEAASPEVAAEIAAALAGRPAIAEVVSITAVIRGSDKIHCRLRLRLNQELFVDGWCSGPAAKPYLAGDPVRWSLDRVVRELADVKNAVRGQVRDLASVEIELL